MSVMTLSPHDVTKHRPINDFQSLAAAIGKLVACDELILLTTMPRGGLQVCRALNATEVAVRRYASELHSHDRTAWAALRNQYSASDENSSAFMPGFDLAIAVRVEGPVFDGFPGVLLVLQRDPAAAGSFDAETLAAQIRRAYESSTRHGNAADHLAHSPRQFIFAGGKSLMPNAMLSSLDPKLAQSIESQLPRLDPPDAGTHTNSRFTLPDSTGNCWPVQFVQFASYPALADGPVTFISLHPLFEDWERLEPSAFAADVETSRLAAAVPFMFKHFRRGPTLEEVAASVHLSQFHFHRRFSDVFGLTPKELLYDLQLEEAKRLLADPRQPLAEIARHCGFSHQSHFTSRFKQGTGLTPTRWRRLSVMGI